jgi:hypothetical protein
MVEWLDAHERAIKEHEQFVKEHQQFVKEHKEAMKALDVRIANLVSGFGEFMQRERA